MRLPVLAAAALAAVLVAPLPAFAWGAVGHHYINNVAIRTLPDFVPAFVRSPAAIAEITILAPEEDHIRDFAGGVAKDDAVDFEGAHFLDMGDDGLIAEAVPLAQLPPTRAAYDTALRKGVVTNGAAPTQYSMGFVPYSVRDGYLVLIEDFAYWRLEAYGEAHAANAVDQAQFALNRQIREALTIRDIGYWGHFVGDASQPLHVSVHYNGWGNYPNPNNYTNSNKIHAKFETTFVNAHTSADAVLAHVAPYVPSTAPILGRVSTYLIATNSFVPKVYQLEGAGAFDAATPEAVNFTLDRLAAGAKMLRDLIADAYTAAGDAKVGYPAVSVHDVEAGSLPLTPAMLGS